MKTLVSILKWVGIVLALLIIVSFFLPGKVHVERSIVIKAQPEAIFANLNNLKSWEVWSPWKKRDSAMKNVYEGPESGVGQKSTWTSEHPKVGNGSMEISESKPNEKLVTKLSFGPGGIGYGTFKLEKMGDSTKVTWMMDSDGEGMNPIMAIGGKYMNLFKMMDKMLGPDFEAGLKSMKEVMESTPASETATAEKTYTVEEVTLEKMIILATPKQIVKSADIKTFFDKNLGLLFADAGKQGLKPGAPSGIFYSWTPEQTEMEAVLAVDKMPTKKGAFAAREIAPAKALKVSYYGPYEGTGPAHMAIEAYAKEKNYKLGAAWETYITDPGSEPDTAKWLTEVCYPLVK